MKNPEKLIGKKVRGFEFKGSLYEKNMDAFIGKVGIIKEYNRGDFNVSFDNDFRWYPADQIEAHLVEEQNEIPTFTKEDLKSFYNIGFANGVDNQNKSSCLEFEKEFNKIFNPTKEEQLTKILGNSDKVAEIMELFKNE